MTRPHPNRRRRHRWLVAPLFATAILATWAAAAGAHVSSEPSAEGATDANGITTVVLTFDHGCDGSPTTGLRVQLPPEVTEPQPVDPDGWTSSITASGDQQVLAWTGGSIPDKTEGRFELRARIVGEAGTVVYLKTVQVCAAGETAWIEVPEDGQPEPEHPAPAVTLTQTVAPGAATTSGTTASTATGSGAGTSASTTRSGSSLLIDDATTEGPAAGTEPGTMGLVVLLVVLAVIAGGAAVLYLRHRSPREPS